MITYLAIYLEYYHGNYLTILRNKTKWHNKNVGIRL